MLLSSFISFSPIITIIACNKKDEIIDRDPEVDKTVELFNTIKTKISDVLSNPETKIYLDSKDLNMKDEDIKQILNSIFEEASKNLKEQIFVSNNIILDKISEKVKDIVNDLNTKLKEIPALENSNKIIELNSLQARMNGNDINALIALISKKQNAPTPDSKNFDYNLQLNLSFKINVSNKEDNYIYNPKSAFITSDKEDLENKRSDLADRLRDNLQDQELDGKKIIDNVLKNGISYAEAFANELNQNLAVKNIKIKKSANMEINREQLSFKLKPLNFNWSYLKKFIDFINEKNLVSTTEQMFSKKSSDSEFYQFKDYENKIVDNKIFIQNYPEFKVTDWSIEGIELPERTFKDIKIYQKIAEIKNSWNNFYKILKYYFNSDTLISFDRMHIKTSEKILNKNIIEVIKKWSNSIKAAIKKNEEKILVYFQDLIETRNTINNYKISNSDSISTTDIAIKLFSDQLILQPQYFSWNFHITSK